MNKRVIGLLLAALCLLAACNDKSTVVYPSDPAVWEGCTIIPSPARNADRDGHTVGMFRV